MDLRFATMRKQSAEMRDIDRSFISDTNMTGERVDSKGNAKGNVTWLS